jgi:pimeloyl-ACP methyl ester carboxylesterase
MSELLTHVVAGQGPPVLLLNGGLMSYRAWDGVASRLESRFTIVTCDFRGQLLSPGEAPPALEWHADDLLHLIDHLGISRVHVAGTSFGALVGIVLASTHGERVASLTAITATDHVTPEMWQGAVALREACEAARRGGDRGAVFDLIALGTFSPQYRRANADLLGARRQAVASLPDAYFAGLERLLDTLQGLDLRPMLPRVTCPTLVLAAGADLTFPLSHSQSLAAAVTNAHLRVLPEAAHGMVLEEPEAVARSMAEFVSAVERGEPEQQASI